MPADPASEDIEILAIRHDPEGRPASSPAFVAGVEQSFIAKVIVADQAFFLSTDRAGMGHFFNYSTLYT